MTHTKLSQKYHDELDSGWSHIAFSVGSKDKVLKLTERLTSNGYFERCIADPEGNCVEITI